MQVGGLLGDFVKGPLRGDYPVAVERGIQLHRHIDAYTDRHLQLRYLAALFPPPWRRYGGIVLDVYWDHLLAHHWLNFSRQPLPAYCGDFYRQLALCAHWLPPRAHQFSERAAALGWLESNADTAVVPRVLLRIGQRLRRPVPLEQAWAAVQSHQPTFARHFQPLMADLHDVVEVWLTAH